MKVKTESARAVAAQKMVMELLVADQPARATSHDPDSKFWHWAEKVEVTESRFPAAERWQGDASHPAMRVNLDACIQCGLCVRACREVQVNDVIGMAYRNARRQDRVRLRRSDGGIDLRRLRRMRAGLPDRRADAGGDARREPDPRHLCRQEGRLAVPVLRRRLPGHLSGQGREGRSTPRAATARPTTTGSASRAASASTTSTIRIA